MAFWHQIPHRSEMTRGRSVGNHKLELVDELLIGSRAYVTSHFTATLVANEKATPISGSTVRLLEHQSDGHWKIKISHIRSRIIKAPLLPR
jgi:hypothetical protein